MKRIRKSKAARFLCWLLTVTMITSISGAIFQPRAAWAQQPLETLNAIPTVIVNDFVNKTNIGGDTLAHYASDAVAQELASSGKFEVIDRKEVYNRGTKDLGFVPPFGETELSKIAQQVQANSYITGEIDFIHVDSKHSPKTVEVGMKVLMHQTSSGDLINGSAQVGIATAKPGLTDTLAMANEAVTNAAVHCVNQMLAYNIPTGIVLSSVGSGNNLQVIINRGSRDGISEGMQMLVTRNGVKVGKLGITLVNPTDSEAKVLENMSGIAPEDHVQAIFPMPAYNVTPGQVANIGRRSSSTVLKSLGTLALAALLGVLIVAAVQGGRNTTITGVVAQPTLYNNNPSVLVIWRDNLFGGNTLEYHIWRSPGDPYYYAGIPIAAVGVGVTQYNDQPAPYTYWDGNHSYLKVPYPPSGGGTNNNGGGTATQTVPTASAATAGFTTGQSYIYSVSSVVETTSISNSSTNTGTNNGTGIGTGTGTTTGTTTTTTVNDIETTPVNSGQATPINQTVLSTPADQATNVDLTNFNPTWFSVTGADQFVVEVSMDRSFKNKSTIAQMPIIWSTSTGAPGVLQEYTAPINLTTNPILLSNPSFANFVKPVPGAAQPVLYWRVGARNSQDVPGPVDWISGDPHDPDRAFRWIYSPVRMFTPAPIPPAHP